MRSRFVFYDGGAGIMRVRRGNGMVGGVKTVALRGAVGNYKCRMPSDEW